ncbi:hypothetical protein V8E55_002927 [Tylopilus felleus]
MLNPQNPHHLWILHVLFLPAINQDCRDFRLEWNCHPIDSIDTNLKSPTDLRFLGQTEFGVYQDDCEGAGHPTDEEVSGDEEDGHTAAHIADLVNRQQQQNVNEDVVFVPSHRSPFTDPEDEATFFGMLNQAIGHQIIPDGFGLRPDEWEDGHYPIFETIRLGRRRSKELENNGKPICHECDHSISKHPGTVTSTPSTTQQVELPPPLPPPPPDPSSSSLLHTSTRQPETAPTGNVTRTQPTLLDIFSNLTESKLKPDHPSLTQTAKARAEAIATFGSQKPKVAAFPRVTSGARKASTMGGSNCSRFPSGSSSIQASSGSSTIFHVSSIGMIVCGIGRNGLLKRPKAPFGKTFASEVQAMKNRGCFITASSPSNGIAINAAWTFAEVNDQVRQWFPQVFAYLDSVRTRTRTSSKSLHHTTATHPEWLVLVRSGSQFSLVEVTEPNGSTLFENKGRCKASVADSMLWFVTRKAVSDNVYNSWNKEPIIVGSDSESEIESPGMGDQKDPDDIISIHDTTNHDSSDIDIKLTSSMLDLKLYQDPGVASKDKGKGMDKSTDPVTPPQKPGKRSRVLWSPIQSPPAVKKRRDVSSRPIPLFFKASPPPQISSAPTSVPISERDVLMRSCHYPDSPNAPHIIHPWSADYAFISFSDFHSYIFRSPS